jgi:hypothetical protein
MPTLGYGAEVWRAVMITLLIWEVTNFMFKSAKMCTHTNYAQNCSISWPKFCMNFSFSTCVCLLYTRRNVLFLYAGD